MSPKVLLWAKIKYNPTIKLSEGWNNITLILCKPEHILLTTDIIIQLHYTTCLKSNFQDQESYKLKIQRSSKAVPQKLWLNRNTLNKV